MEKEEKTKKQFPYEDILSLSRPVSRTHPPMPRLERAAQFSPFAALTGYDTAIEEAARQTEPKRELDEQRQDLLNEALERLAQKKAGEVCLEVTYFCPDEKKAGGHYETMTAFFAKLDFFEKRICFTNGVRIDFTQLFVLKEVEKTEQDTKENV